MRFPATKGTILSGFALGLIGLCFVLLLHEAVITKQAWQVIPKVAAGLMAPVPLAIFIAFLYAKKAGTKALEPSPVRMSVYLVVSIALTIGAGYLMRDSPDAPPGTGAAIAESSVFSASLLNYLFLRSPLIASALSGVSIGLTVFLIFLT